MKENEIDVYDEDKENIDKRETNKKREEIKKIKEESCWKNPEDWKEFVVTQTSIKNYQ